MGSGAETLVNPTAPGAVWAGIAAAWDLLALSEVGAATPPRGLNGSADAGAGSGRVELGGKLFSGGVVEADEFRPAGVLLDLTGSLAPSAGNWLPWLAGSEVQGAGLAGAGDAENFDAGPEASAGGFAGGFASGLGSGFASGLGSVRLAGAATGGALSWGGSGWLTAAEGSSSSWVSGGGAGEKLSGSSIFGSLAA